MHEIQTMELVKAHLLQVGEMVLENDFSLFTGVGLKKV
jgi:hypothetical protein